MNYGGHFDIDSKYQRISFLEQEMMVEGFWNDKKTAEGIIDELNQLKQVVESITLTKNSVIENIEILNDCEKDDEIISIMGDEIKQINKDVDKLEINLLLDVTARRENGYHDIVTIMQSVKLSDYVDFDTKDITTENLHLCLFSEFG